MGRYKLSKQAEFDLAEIWRYTLENWSREQADKYISGLLNAFSEIGTSPETTGQSYEHVLEGYRKCPFGKHIIFYKVLMDDDVLISRVLHERMDFDRHL